MPRLRQLSILSLEVWVEGVQFDAETNSFRTTGEAWGLKNLDVLRLFQIGGNKTGVLEVYRWAKEDEDVPTLVPHRTAVVDLEWGPAQPWVLESAEPPPWTAQTEAAAIVAALGAMVVAIDEASWGWQKKARFFDVVEGIARREGVHPTVEKGGKAFTAAASIRDQIARGERRDAPE